ncbi:MAG: diadenylate cyclase CdaA [Planctomycetota bacterium]|jgi:diadenylate cyclase
MKEFIDAITTYLDRIGTYNLFVVAVELLLIGAVVWWVMRFLRGTRGARLVKGLALLLVTVYVVIRVLPKNIGGDRELGWERIEFLYGKFLLFAFVATVVAFQPELRRALIQIGQARIFRGRQQRVSAMIEAIVDSAAYLSRNKIGAIVAVERSVGLGALMQSGTTVDADLSAGLLNTIFYPGSALHDMGVIVSEGRVATAGCQFPLAESDDVDPSLGSRHRAALGLAQESDAVVVVVSEETGRISLACEGQLYLGLEPPALKEMLIGLLGPRRKPRRKARRLHALNDQ